MDVRRWRDGLLREPLCGNAAFRHLHQKRYKLGIGPRCGDLWFSYGSPGFDASLWPSTWYDGTAMTDARYAALAHILLSDTFSSNGSYALYGCNESFKEWCRYNVIGFDSSGTMCNDDATGRKISRM